MVQVGKSSLRACCSRHLTRNVPQPTPWWNENLKKKKYLSFNLPSVEPPFVPHAANQSLPAASITAHASAIPCRSPPVATRSAHAPTAWPVNIIPHHRCPTTALSADRLFFHERQIRARKMDPAPEPSVPGCSAQ